LKLEIASMVFSLCHEVKIMQQQYKNFHPHTLAHIKLISHICIMPTYLGCNLLKTRLIQGCQMVCIFAHEIPIRVY
jgi:hypothetical protein